MLDEQLTNTATRTKSAGPAPHKEENLDMGVIPRVREEGIYFFVLSAWWRKILRLCGATTNEKPAKIPFDIVPEID